LGLGIAQVVDHLLSKHDALSSNTTTDKKKKKKKKEKRSESNQINFNGQKLTNV
jgi:hypothetical protein